MKEKNTYSRIVLGVMAWGKLEKGRIIDLLQHCVEQHITSFDHADFLGNGYADKIFGTAISESGLSRDEIQLISKIPAEKNSKKAIIKTVEDSLLALKTDYLDLLLLKPSKQLSEIMEAVAQLSSQGKIKEIGGLNLQKEQLEIMENYVPVRANQVKFSAVFSGPGQELHKKPSEEIIPFIWYFPEGISVEKATALKKLASKYHCNQNQLLLAWIFKHPGYLHAVVHFQEEGKITEIVASEKINLDPVDWQKIKQLLM